MRWDIVAEYSNLFISGALMTVVVSIIGIVGGLLLGFLIGLLRLHRNPSPRLSQTTQLWQKSGYWFSSAYVGFFRGTPLFVQILLIHFAVMPLFINYEQGLLIQSDLARYLLQGYGAFISGCLALVLNASAYIAEIFRAGIQSIHLGQTQAAESLGMTKRQSMRYVIAPQALRRMVPPLINESVTLIKDSSLISAIGLAEMAFAARTAAGAYARYWEPYIAISIIYLIITLTLSFWASKLEVSSKKSGR